MEKVLSRFGYSDCKLAPAPYDASVIIQITKWIMKDELRYSWIIGSLMYSSVTSQFISNLGDENIGVCWCLITTPFCYYFSGIFVLVLILARHRAPEITLYLHVFYFRLYFNNSMVL